MKLIRVLQPQTSLSQASCKIHGELKIQPEQMSGECFTFGCGTGAKDEEPIPPRQPPTRGAWGQWSLFLQYWLEIGCHCPTRFFQSGDYPVCCLPLSGWPCIFHREMLLISVDWVLIWKKIKLTNLDRCEASEAFKTSRLTELDVLFMPKAIWLKWDLQGKKKSIFVWQTAGSPAVFSYYMRPGMLFQCCISVYV